MLLKLVLFPVESFQHYLCVSSMVFQLVKHITKQQQHGDIDNNNTRCANDLFLVVIWLLIEIQFAHTQLARVSSN